jgi:alanine dehydrogenase
MGYLDDEYVSSSRVRVVDEDVAYRQDVVVVLRAPIGKFEKIRRGATLISMLHFPTRPARVRTSRSSRSTRSASTRSRTTRDAGSS